jgi:hypothetical protein
MACHEFYGKQTKYIYQIYMTENNTMKLNFFNLSTRRPLQKAQEPTVDTQI